jgi:hypothetical protein
VGGAAGRGQAGCELFACGVVWCAWRPIFLRRYWFGVIYLQAPFILIIGIGLQLDLSSGDPTVVLVWGLLQARPGIGVD